MSEEKIKICYFPGRESSYSRNRVLIRGMNEAGMVIHDCSSPQKNFTRYISSFFKFLKHKKDSDIIFIGFLGQFIVPIVKLFTRKKILFEAFVSIYETLAFDRKAINPNGLIAQIAKFMDRLSCNVADKVILDTYAHIKYFVDELKLDKGKFAKVPVGSDDSVMFPKEKADDEFIVHFHGEFQALHGAEYIIDAAKLLPDTKFRFIGQGKALKTCKEKAAAYGLTNVEFKGPVPYEKLSSQIKEASICLGIFGKTLKTNMVIPHKIYEALAMKKPVITADTVAIRELLTHAKNVFLCDIADGKSIADAIKILKNDEALRNTISENGYQVFKSQCSPGIIGHAIKKIALEEGIHG